MAQDNSVAPTPAPPPPPTPARNQWPWVVAVGLAVLTAVAYASSLSGAWMFDDFHTIVDNPSVRKLPDPVTLATGDNRPVLMATFALNYAVNGTNILGYHLVNILIHFLAGLLLFDLALLLLIREPEGSPLRREATPLAFAISALWLVHPLQTESVTYVVHRSESLMGLFYLLTLVALVRGANAAEAGTQNRAWVWYGVGLLACALGMKTKEPMVTAPLTCLLLDRVYLAASWRDLVSRRWGLYLGLAASWAFLVGEASASLSGEIATVGFAHIVVSPMQYLVSQAGVVLAYLQLAIIPYPLCIDRNWPVADDLWQAMPALVTVGALVLGSIWLLIRRPKLGFLGFAFFLILAPTSSVMPISDLMVERRMYVPLAPLLALIIISVRCALEPRTSNRGLVLATLTAAGFGVVFLGLTILRNLDYRSSLHMWEQVVQLSPKNARARNNLGVALEKEDRLQEAEKRYQEALDLNPGSDGHFNYGRLLVRTGRNKEAVPHLRFAVGNRPANVDAWGSLAAALARLGETDEAMTAAKKVVELAPESSPGHLTLAGLLETKSDYDAAERHYLLARKFGNTETAPRRLGWMLVKVGRPADAIPHLAESAKASPQSALAASDLAFAYFLIGDNKQAAQWFQSAHRLDPQWPSKVAAAAWSKATNPDAAARDGLRAIALARQAMCTNPNDPWLLDTLAAALAETGRYPDAASAARLAANLLERRGDQAGKRAVLARQVLYESKQPYRGDRIPR